MKEQFSDYEKLNFPILFLEKPKTRKELTQNLKDLEQKVNELEKRIQTMEKFLAKG